jgi:hypothetical protein
MLERTAQILQNKSLKCASPIPTRLLTPSRIRKEIDLYNKTPIKGMDTPLLVLKFLATKNERFL